MAVRPEVILCDTSFLGHAERAERVPERYEHWSRSDLDRIDTAILAVTPFALAEMRAGRIAGGWSARRSEDQERRLGGLLLIPLDVVIVDRWAELRAHGLTHGWGVRDNDLWIAATAIAKEISLVSCDADHCKVPGLDLIFLPVDPAE